MPARHPVLFWTAVAVIVAWCGVVSAVPVLPACGPAVCLVTPVKVAGWHGSVPSSPVP